MTLNKTILWKDIDLNKFKQKWSEKKKLLIKTVSFKMNRKILKSGFELKNYFKELIDLNPEKEYEYLSGNSFYKFGGCFTLFNQSQDFLIKFVLTPSKKLCIQMIEEKELNEKFMEFMLNSFEFLFSDNL